MPITTNGHPWGGERESAKMTGFEASATEPRPS